MYNLTIPKPCFENWEQMLPNEKGRHCEACAKTVVDFTVMTDDEVKDYFISHPNNAVCGRFKNTQLQRIQIELPQNVFRLQLPFWKKFLAVLLICFGSSFLPIETVMAGNSFKSNTYTHTLTFKDFDKKKKKENKKKRHKIKKKILIPFIFDGMPTMGIVAPSERKNTEQELHELIFASPTYKTDSKIVSIYQAIPTDKEVPTPPTNPPTKNEMLLTTSSFSIRKYLFKEKKL